MPRRWRLRVTCRFGVEELETEKRAPVLRLRYCNSRSDAIACLETSTGINVVFVAFQNWLYTTQAA
jgi:type I restriction enzyme R subunit